MYSHLPNTSTAFKVLCNSPTIQATIIRFPSNTIIHKSALPLYASWIIIFLFFIDLTKNFRKSRGIDKPALIFHLPLLMKINLHFFLYRQGMLQLKTSPASINPTSTLKSASSLLTNIFQLEIISSKFPCLLPMIPNINKSYQKINKHFLIMDRKTFI